LPDPNGQLAIITARIIERTAQIEALDGAREIDKSELKTLATPFYFTQASGKVDVANGVSVVSPAGEVLITFPNRYCRLEYEGLVAKRTTDPYPIQLRSPEEEFVGWVKHRWAY